MRENVKLYRIEDGNGIPRVLEGTAKVTACYITFAVITPFSRYETKTSARNLDRVYFETPEAAWSGYCQEQEQRRLDAKLAQEKATGNLAAGHRALEAIWLERRTQEVK
jgi:hypothetical protein